MLWDFLNFVWNQFFLRGEGCNSLKILVRATGIWCTIPRRRRLKNACVIVRARCSPASASYGLWPTTSPPTAAVVCSCDISSFSASSARCRLHLRSSAVFACPSRFSVIFRPNSLNHLRNTLKSQNKIRHVGGFFLSARWLFNNTKKKLCNTKLKNSYTVIDAMKKWYFSMHF